MEPKKNLLEKEHNLPIYSKPPLLYSMLLPWKLTCPPKKDYFSREYIFQPLIFRGHVSFQGCNFQENLGNWTFTLL